MGCMGDVGKVLASMTQSGKTPRWIAVRSLDKFLVESRFLAKLLVITWLGTRGLA